MKMKLEMLPSPTGIYFIAFPRARIAYARRMSKTFLVPALLQPHGLADMLTVRVLLLEFHNNTRLKIDYLTHGGYLPLLMV